MADVTVIATAGITGAVGVFATYWQARMANRQLQAQLESQRQHVVAQDRKEYRAERRAAYHLLLDKIDELEGMLTGVHPIDRESIGTWRLSFRHVLNGARLAGSDGVVEGIQDLLTLLAELSEHADRLALGTRLGRIPTAAEVKEIAISFDDLADEGLRANLVTAYSSLAPKFEQTYDAIRDAMRGDLVKFGSA